MIRTGGQWEESLNSLFGYLYEQTLVKDAPVIDLGMNFGSFALFAASKGANVFALEMQDELITMVDLSSRLSRYSSHLSLYHAALWYEDGLEMSYTPDIGNYGGTGLHPNSNQQIPIQTKRADSILFEHPYFKKYIVPYLKPNRFLQNRWSLNRSKLPATAASLYEGRNIYDIMNLYNDIDLRDGAPTDGSATITTVSSDSATAASRAMVYKAKSVFFLKVDVELVEYEVLLSLDQFILSRAIQHVVFEARYHTFERIFYYLLRIGNFAYCRLFDEEEIGCAFPYIGEHCYFMNLLQAREYFELNKKRMLTNKMPRGYYVDIHCSLDASSY